MFELAAVFSAIMVVMSSSRGRPRLTEPDVSELPGSELLGGSLRSNSTVSVTDSLMTRQLLNGLLGAEWAGLTGLSWAVGGHLSAHGYAGGNGLDRMACSRGASVSELQLVASSVHIHVASSNSPRLRLRLNRRLHLDILHHSARVGRAGRRRETDEGPALWLRRECLLGRR